MIVVADASVAALFMTLYDAVYVALAGHTGAPVLTNDHSLAAVARKIGVHAPLVADAPLPPVPG